MAKFRPLLVVVEWMDAATYTEAYDLEDVINDRVTDLHLSPQVTQGDLVCVNEVECKISHTKSADLSDVRDVTVIPWSWITKVKTGSGRVLYRKEIK